MFYFINFIQNISDENITGIKQKLGQLDIDAYNESSSETDKLDYMNQQLLI